MKKILYYLTIFIISSIIFAIFSAPSALLKPYIDKNIQINYLNGKIINGEANGITINKSLLAKLNLTDIDNSIYVDKINWQLKSIDVFPLAITTKVKLKIASKTISLILKVDADKTIYLKDISLDILISEILKLVKQPNDILAGNLEFFAKNIIIKNNNIADADIKLHIKNLNILGQDIGNIGASINYQKDKKDFIIKPKSIKSNIDISGIISIKLNGKYNISLQLKAGKDANQDLKDMLSLIGYNSGGSRIIKLIGTI